MKVRELWDELVKQGIVQERECDKIPPTPWVLGCHGQTVYFETHGGGWLVPWYSSEDGLTPGMKMVYAAVDEYNRAFNRGEEVGGPGLPPFLWGPRLGDGVGQVSMGSIDGGYNYPVTPGSTGLTMLAMAVDYYNKAMS